MDKKRRLALTGTALVGFMCAFGIAGTASAAQDADPSSACIRCHTDLEEMDSYGAAAASGAAAIAG